MTVLALNTALGLMAFFQSKHRASGTAFFIFSLTATVWGLTMFLYRGSSDPAMVALFARLLYVGAAMIPIAFFFFIDAFTGDGITYRRILKYGLFLSLIACAYISFVPGLLISGVEFPPGAERVILFSHSYYLVYSLYITLLFALGYVVLFSKFFRAQGLLRRQLGVIIAGTLVSTIIGVSTNLTLPYFGIFALNWAGQVGVLAMVGSIAYAVLRYNLFNTKVVATQLVTVLLWVSLLVRTLLSSSSRDLSINGAFLAISILIGILLIRSVMREVAQREKLEALTKDLEVANEKLKSLDKLKTEFLSLASHQIRSPLTAIKGYSSMLLEGSFGALGAEQKEAADRIFQTSSNLAIMVEDFLSVSKIEAGGMKYAMEPFDIRKVAEDTAAELRLAAEQKGLTMSFSVAEDGEMLVKGDREKVRQVILNLADNAIKYTPEGSVTVSVARSAGTVLVSITDTGIGVSAETKQKLFEKFNRGEGGKLNATGSGLGLYLAKEIIAAHGGKVWVESEGAGKGSSFIVAFKAYAA